MAEYKIISKQQQQQQQFAATSTLNRNRTETSSPSTVNKFHTIAKRKLEKIKNKFAEFFLSSSSTTQTASKLSTPTSSASAIYINSTTQTDNINQSTTSINDFSNKHQISNYQQHDLSYVPHNSFLFSNIKNLKRFNSHYQSNNDDEEFQLNLFDRTFMIDYIAFKLINELKQSDLITKFHLDLRIPYFKNEFNLIYSIAKQIYNESESEPMGLNGLNIIIELELNDIELQQQPNKFIKKFRFNSNSTLTTFELKLVLKEDQNIICLRKFLPKSKLFDKLRTQSAIYLDSRFNLVKRKLY